MLDIELNKPLLRHLALVSFLCAAIVPTLGYTALWYIIGAIVGG